MPSLTNLIDDSCLSSRRNVDPVGRRGPAVVLDQGLTLLPHVLAVGLVERLEPNLRERRGSGLGLEIG